MLRMRNSSGIQAPSGTAEHGSSRMPIDFQDFSMTYCLRITPKASMCFPITVLTRLRSWKKGRNGRVTRPTMSTCFVPPWTRTRSDAICGYGIRNEGFRGPAKGAARHGSEADSLDVARRLPGVYAASLASHVDRLFWLCMENPTSTIAVAAQRYGFFDANLEPMPQLAAYDAMTEVIGDSRFVRRFERGDGLIIYFYENEKETIIMVFNWHRRESSFNVEFSGPGYQVSM